MFWNSIFASPALLQYFPDMTTNFLNEPVGALAEKDFTALAQNLTVTGALAQIREHGAAQQIIYFYVVDAEQRLVGVLPTRRLLLAAPDARLQEIMIDRIVTIPETATVLEACGPAFARRCFQSCSEDTVSSRFPASLE